MITLLQQQLAQRDAQIADLEQRAHWLQTQAHAAHHELEAVRQGRTLRLLALLRRTRRRLAGKNAHNHQESLP
jgi:hypothetical protein